MAGRAVHERAARAPDLTRHTPPADFTLSSAAWARFHEESWERHATVIRCPWTAPLAEPAQTFERLVEACDRWRAGERDDRLRFFIDQAQLLADLAPMLPVRADGSAAGYAERISRMLRGRRFGLVVEEFQAYDATLWLRLRDLLRGLYDITGLPAEAAKATLFLGDYEATPWGLHRGRSGNFQFVVEGPKRIRTWPDSYWRGREDMSYRTDYQPYAADATVLDGDAGDVLYWPHDWWHVGEAVGGACSVAISVALFFHDDGGAGDLLAHAAPLVRRALGQTAGSVLRPDSNDASRMASAVERARDALRATSDEPQLARALLAARLNHATGYGFAIGPAPLPPRPLADEELVQGTPPHPILFVESHADTLVCSANGRSFTATASPHVRALLDRLNRGAPHTVRELVAAHSGTATVGQVTYETSPERIRALLEKLAAWRAIVVR